MQLVKEGHNKEPSQNHCNWCLNVGLSSPKSVAGLLVDMVLVDLEGAIRGAQWHAVAAGIISLSVFLLDGARGAKRSVFKWLRPTKMQEK